MEDNDLIIICVTIISLVIIVSVASFAMSGYNPLNPKGGVLSSNDLQLNMTGYDYKLVTNSSMVVNGVTASCVVYNVSGNDDNFNLTILTIPDSESFKDFSMLNGTASDISTVVHLNGCYYAIQFTGANYIHNNVNYINSILLTKGIVDANNNTNSGVVSNSQSTNSANSAPSSSNSGSDDGSINKDPNTNDEGLFSGVAKMRYCTTHGWVVTHGSNRCPYCEEEGLDSRTVKGSTHYVD